MFTLLVSCLLVACVPVLLMMAALALGRLERDLGGTAAATHAGAFAVRTDTVDVHALARGGIPEALDYLDLRQSQRLSGVLPTGRHALPTHAAPLFAVDLPVRDGLGVPMRGHTQTLVSEHVKLHRAVDRG